METKVHRDLEGVLSIPSERHRCSTGGSVVRAQRKVGSSRVGSRGTTLEREEGKGLERVLGRGRGTDGREGPRPTKMDLVQHKWEGWSDWTRRVLAEAGEDPQVLILFPLFALLVGSICNIFAIACRRSRLGKHTPRHTVLVLIAGLLIGTAERGSKPSGVLSDSIASWANISPELIMYVFLPPLLFADAFFVDLYTFLGAIYQILWLCIPGVLATTFLLATLAKYTLAAYGWTWQLSIAFGAILAGIDPVGVVALFKSVKAEEKLSMIIIGESHLCDGVSSVVFFLFLDMLTGKRFSGGEVVENIFKSAFGGPAIGLAIALAAGLVIISPFLKVYNTIVQIALSVCVAWLSFFAAEINLHANGLLAVIAGGVLLGFMSWTSITGQARDAMEHFWHTMEFFANTIIFTLAGIIIVEAAQGNIVGRDWGYLFMMYCLVMIVRGVVIACSIPVLNRLGPALDWRKGLVIWWGGLRGALTLAFALILSLTSQETDGDGEEAYPDLTSLNGERVLFLTGGVAAITLLLNGSTTGLLTRWLGMTELDPGQKILIHETRRMLFKELNKSYDKLSGPTIALSQGGHEYHFLAADYEVVARHVPSLVEHEDNKRKRKYLKKALSMVELEDPEAYTEAATMKEVRSRFLHSLSIQYENMLSGKLIPRRIAQNLRSSIDHALDMADTKLADWDYVYRCCASYGWLRRKLRRLWQRACQYIGYATSSRHSKRLLYALSFLEAHLEVQKEMCEVVRAAQHMQTSASSYSLFDHGSSLHLGSLASINEHEHEVEQEAGASPANELSGNDSFQSVSEVEHVVNGNGVEDVHLDGRQKTVRFSPSVKKPPSMRKSRSFAYQNKAKAARFKANLIMMNFDDEGCFLRCVEKILDESEALCEEAHKIVMEEVVGNPSIAKSVKNQQVIKQLLHHEISIVKGMLHHGLLDSSEAGDILQEIELKILRLPHVSRYSRVYLP